MSKLFKAKKIKSVQSCICGCWSSDTTASEMFSSWKECARISGDRGSTWLRVFCVSYSNGVPWTEPQSVSPTLTSLASHKAAISCCLSISWRSGSGEHRSKVLRGVLWPEEREVSVSGGLSPEQRFAFYYGVPSWPPNATVRRQRQECGLHANQMLTVWAGGFTPCKGLVQLMCVCRKVWRNLSKSFFIPESEVPQLCHHLDFPPILL